MDSRAQPATLSRRPGTTLAPVAKLVATSANDPKRLAEFRAQLDSLIEKWFQGNRVRQGFLMTRALKR